MTSISNWPDRPAPVRGIDPPAAVTYLELICCLPVSRDDGVVRIFPLLSSSFPLMPGH